MLTLKEHYDKVLVGMNEEELKVYSLELRLEMNQMKFDIECRNIAHFIRPERKKLTQINKNRLYLRETYRVLERIDSLAKPPEEDLTASIFRENIPYIKKVVYIYGGYFGGFDIYNITFNNNQVEVNKEVSDFGCAQLYLDKIDDVEYFEKPEHRENNIERMSKEDFIKTIKRLHMGEWRKEYLDRDYGSTVMDGSSWNIEIHYSNNQRQFECGGINAYPYNFYEFNRLIEKAYEVTQIK